MNVALICVIASIGFAFDTYELLMLPLVLPPALKEFGLTAAQLAQWRGLMFWVPALAGGAFGLYGGYLTDLLGRRRVLTGSILLYAAATCATAFATSPWVFLVLRTLTFVGVCVEFVAAVAWLAELFPDPRQRERVLGFTQAFGSLGGLMVTYVYAYLVGHAGALPALLGAHAPWRYTLLSGLIPALPLIVVRPFLPESPVWVERSRAGTLKRPSVSELFTPALRSTTLLTTLMVAMSFAAAFGALQQLPSIVPKMALLANAPERVQQEAVAMVQKAQEWGGLVGRLALAFLATRVASRRELLWMFQLPGIVLLPIVFHQLAKGDDLAALATGVFLAGICTVAQFSFWGNYLPLVFPTHLRGTGEGFAANIGGRMLGTSAAWIASVLAASGLGLPDAAALVAGLAYLVGFGASFYLPEPDRELRS